MEAGAGKQNAVVVSVGAPLRSLSRFSILFAFQSGFATTKDRYLSWVINPVKNI
jgi:hypothetical protein